LAKLFNDIKNKKIDVVFIALHGRGGEDGTIQGMLELLNVPYTGSGVLGSAMAMDKEITKRLFDKEGIPTPKWFVFRKDEAKEKDFSKKAIKQIKKQFGFPAVVKPFNSGSSVDVFIVKNEKEFLSAVKKIIEQFESIIVEKYQKGIEITVGVLGNKNPIALPVVGIYPKKEFFDYQAKYNPEFCREIAPAPIPAWVTKKVQEMALKSYSLLKCRGFSRIDMILDKKKIFVLEANTIPGLTPVSLLPKVAAAAGISFSRLVEIIIKLALEK